MDGLNRRVCNDVGINCYMYVRKAIPRLREWYETGRMVKLDGGDARKRRPTDKLKMLVEFLYDAWLERGL